MKMKETFCSYADFNDGDSKKIHDEMEELKNELDKTRNIVRVQRVRYQQLVSLFSAKLQEKEEETRNDLQIKHIQLTRILRALYILEAKLRKEQRYLKNTLIERDALIKTQQRQINELKKEIEKITQNRCPACIEVDPKQSPNKTTDMEPKNADNKPDLISSIGIEIRKDTAADNSRPAECEPVSNKLENDEENTYIISSLDDYDASLSSLHVRGASADETKQTFPQTGSGGGQIEHNQNANNENLRNRIIDEELQNEMRKFKMKDNEHEESFKTSPRMILKEVTENPNEKLNGPVLKCVKQILSIDKETRKSSNNKLPAKNMKSQNFAENTETMERTPQDTSNRKRLQHPVKPPKPNFSESVISPKNNEQSRNSRFETNVSKTFLYENTLSVKPLQKCEKNQPALSNHKCPNETPNDHSQDVEIKHVNNENEHIYESVTTDESKIVQTVASLLSESGESEDEKSETSPTVSQMVKKFEGLKCNKKIINKQTLNSSKNDSMVFQTNFEEFHLVDKEIETTCEDIVKDNAIRLEAEGEENGIPTTIIETTNTNNAKYETFLEVTGLSQKSILTPSRILSNHRNVVKPKDVKYRNRVKAAAIGEKCTNGSTITSPTMKYWTEPYL